LTTSRRQHSKSRRKPQTRPRFGNGSAASIPARSPASTAKARRRRSRRLPRGVRGGMERISCPKAQRPISGPRAFMRRGLARNTRALIAANGYRRTGVSMAESDGCLRRFDTRIVLPSGTELITLRDAIRHFSETVPKREHKHPRVLLAATALTDAAEGRTAQRLPRIPLRTSYRPHLNISSDCRHCRKCGRARPGPTDRTILECPPRQSSSRRGRY
jgi:hypothetical protein